MAEDKQEKAAKRAISPITRRVEFEKKMKEFDGSLWRLLCALDEDFIKVTVLTRSDGYLAVGNRYWETEAVYVAFGFGETVFDALKGLAGKWYQRDAWKLEESKEEKAKKAKK